MWGFGNYEKYKKKGCQVSPLHRFVDLKVPEHLPSAGNKD